MHLATRVPRMLRAGLAAAAITALFGLPSALGQSQAEAALKAKLTLSLTRFAQWPAGSVGDTLRLCVAQRDAAIIRAFSEVNGLVVNGRRIQVVRGPPVVGCNVLFVHSSAERVPDLIRAATGGPTLVVGDADGTLALGGMVEFVSVDDAIRFDVNMAAVRHGQLTISSQVLKLARQVRE